MATNESVKKIAEMIEDVKVAILTSVGQNGMLHSRPMMVQDQEFDGDLWFITGKNTVKTDEIEANPNVNVAFSDPDDDIYVSITGKARVVNDRAKIDELWSPVHKAWFPEGKDDPNITLLHVDPELAEYWDSSDRKLVQLVGFVKALAQGERYQGEGSDHGTVKL